MSQNLHVMGTFYAHIHNQYIMMYLDHPSESSAK